jgi:predicted Fe-S protein YdhL (DUF1289 family)
MSKEQDLTRSPCLGLCQFDYDLDICRGCGRMVEEVINWQTFADKQKIEINLRLKQWREQQLKSQ